MKTLKRIIVTVLSLSVVAGAYGIAFGIPDQVTQLFGGTYSEQARASGGDAVGARRSRGATTVVMAPLEERSYRLVLRTIGSAVSLRRTDVVTTEAGEVVETVLRANRLVEKGEPIVRLDDRTERLSLEIALAERDKAQDTVTRYKGLSNNGNSVVTAVALSEAKIALRLADANVGLAELALENRTIVAPISGRLGLSDVNVGDRLISGQAIVTIDDFSALLAEFEVPERSIGLLSEGRPVSVSTPTYAGRIFEGRVTAFDSRLDSVTRSATVQAEIDNSEGLLLSGMTFTARMSEETDPMPVVPSTAITWDRTGAGIWVVKEGKTTRVPVAIRYRSGDQVWVETTAPIGAQIVTEGASKLREGSNVATQAAAGEQGA